MLTSKHLVSIYHQDPHVLCCIGGREDNTCKPAKLRCLSQPPTLSLVFRWGQGGSSFHVVANAVAVSGDGSVVLGGSTTNMWGDPLGGSSDFTAYKLDAEGMLLWTWQVESRVSL